MAATLAQASLLLALGEKGSPLARRLLLVTIVLAALVALMTSMLVLGYDPGGEAFYRGLGVVAILDVLGTVVGAALMKFGPGTSPEGAATTVTVSAELAARLASHTAATGQPRDEVVATALDRYLTQSAPGVQPGERDRAGDEARETGAGEPTAGSAERLPTT